MGHRRFPDSKPPPESEGEEMTAAQEIDQMRIVTDAELAKMVAAEVIRRENRQFEKGIFFGVVLAVAAVSLAWWVA